MKSQGRLVALSVLGVLLLASCRAANGPCQSSADCLDSEICVADWCRQACNRSDDCQGEEICQNGACMPSSAAPPADAARADAAGVDASTFDAPVADRPRADTPTADGPTADNPTTDTPTTDVLTADGPTTDRPTTDAPTTDLSTPDRPAPDLATPDQATPDLATTDAPTTDGLTPDAAEPAVCGNGVIEAGESCDDGNTSGFDGCSATCQVSSGYDCYGEPSTCARSSDIILVPQARPTIQSAVDYADDGETIVVSQGTYNEDVVIDNLWDLTIVADGDVTIEATGPGDDAVVVTDDSIVALIGLHVTTSGGGDDGIWIENGSDVIIRRCHIGPTNGIGIVTTAGGDLTMTESVVSGGADGCADLQTSYFIVENSIFFGCTGNNTRAAAVNFADYPDTGSRFRFNTVVQNLAGVTSGVIRCSSPSVDIVGTIIASNAGGPDLVGCTPSYCLIGDTPASGTNITGDPLLDGDYHLRSMSPCVDQGGPSGPSRDFDGEPRPRGIAFDIGADEAG